VSIGAFLLAWVLWGDEHADQPADQHGMPAESEPASIPASSATSASSVSPASPEI
jgi:hypothetical protein